MRVSIDGDAHGNGAVCHYCPLWGEARAVQSQSGCVRAPVPVPDERAAMSDQKKINEDEKDDSTADRWWIVGAGVVATLFLALSHVFYWLWRNSVGNGFGEDKWGQYGDFIGGITNPIISLLTFGGLLYTILVQRRELALQRRELSNSSKALKATEEELRQTKEIAAGQAEFYRKESKKADLEKVMVRISENVIGLLGWRPSRGVPSLEEELKERANEYVRAYQKKANVISHYSEEADLCLGQIVYLDDLVRKYENIEPESDVSTFYGMKHERIVLILRGAFGEDSEKLRALYNASARRYL